MFDTWYRNTSDIVPTAITGDMHSVNKANFAILHWFGLRFEPRFTDLDQQLKGLCCADDPARYAKCLIRPVGQIDRQAIVDEKANLDQIVATLGLKEMTQGTLIRETRTKRGLKTRQAILPEVALSDDLCRDSSGREELVEPAKSGDHRWLAH